MAPTRRRSATTMVCTEDRRSPTSAVPVRSATTVTERSPPATRLAIAPAAFTGKVTRWLSRRQKANSNASAAPNSTTVQSTMLAAVVRAAAYAAALGWRNTTHHLPLSTGTVTTSSSPAAPESVAVSGRSRRGTAAASGIGCSKSA